MRFREKWPKWTLLFVAVYMGITILWQAVEMLTLDEIQESKEDTIIAFYMTIVVTVLILVWRRRGKTDERK